MNGIEHSYLLRWGGILVSHSSRLQLKLFFGNEWRNERPQHLSFSLYYLRLYRLINLLFFSLYRKNKLLLYNNISNKSRRPDTIMQFKCFKEVHKNLFPLTPFNGDLWFFSQKDRLAEANERKIVETIAEVYLFRASTSEVANQFLHIILIHVNFRLKKYFMLRFN